MTPLIHSTKEASNAPSVLRSESSPPMLGHQRRYVPPAERRDPRMSLAVERRTVSLWLVDESPVTSGPRRPSKPAAVQPTADTKDPAREALAAITSSYRDGRAGIISGDGSPSTGRPGEDPSADPAPPTHFPTVPLDFLSSPKPAAVPAVPPAVEDPEATTLWSRIVRTRRPAPRGRHSPKS